MENLYLAVIPAEAGIQWLQELRDPRLRGDDGKLVFFDTLIRGNDGEVGAWFLLYSSPEGSLSGFRELSAREFF